MFQTFYSHPLASLCKTARRHWTRVNDCRVCCEGVSNMLLVISITFYCHYNMGCTCSTGPFQCWWLKGYIYSSCYCHQIASIHLSHCYHILPWSSAWDVCCIIFCRLLHIHSGKTLILFSLLLLSLWWVQTFGYALACRSYFSLYITPSHYHNCANMFIWRHWTYEMHVRYIVSSVRLSVLSQLSIIHYVELCVFSLPISHVMIEIICIYTLCYHHQIGSMNYYPLFRCMSIFVW